jgi:hypothetical protein
MLYGIVSEYSNNQVRVWHLFLILFEKMVLIDCRYLDYCVRRLRLLQQFGVTPVVIFDGGHLPIKGSTERERRK